MAQDGTASIQLPVASAGGGGGGRAAVVAERVDSWNAFGRAQRDTGKVLEVGGTRMPAQGTPDAPDRVAALDLLCSVDVFPLRVQARIARIKVELSGGGTQTLKFPGEIANVVVADKGRRKEYFHGLKEILRVEDEKGYTPWKRAGERLLLRARDVADAGDAKGRTDLLEWALTAFAGGRKRVPGGNRKVVREILILQLEAASQLRKHELVLQLAFEHLDDKLAGNEEVLEFVGDLLRSRTFLLREMALVWYQSATGRSSAQQKAAETYLELELADKALLVIQDGLSTSLPDVALLAARAQLQAGNLAEAQRLAQQHQQNPDAALRADARQVLGGVAYARGRAGEAEQHFMEAVQAQPRRSTVYSDLGLALAVQGKGADAEACFARALELDSIDNAVVPELGRAYLLMAKPDLAGALQKLSQTEGDNPQDLLVRAFVGYAQELNGNLKSTKGGAENKYEAVLRADYHYRFAIARLGVVKALLAQSGDVPPNGGDEDAVGEMARAAHAHLRKAIELNPKDPLLRYFLARFLMTEVWREAQKDGRVSWAGIKDREAKMLFESVASLPAPEREPNLPLWAEAALGVLAYRDPAQVEDAALGVFDDTLKKIKRLPKSRVPGKPEQHPVWVYSAECEALVRAAMGKILITWRFESREVPRDWEAEKSGTSRLRFDEKDGLVRFLGRMDLQGKKGTPRNFADSWSMRVQEADSKGILFVKDFYKAEFWGRVAPGSKVELSMGVVSPKRQAQGEEDFMGVALKPDSLSDGTSALRVSGDKIRKDRDKPFREPWLLDKVAWPRDGKFHIVIEVLDPKAGIYSVKLNGVDVLDAQGVHKAKGEVPRCNLFTRSARNRALWVIVWAEGAAGAAPAEDTYLDKVTLTLAKN
ncbi:MAG: tetratricopeptide repeat protein [Planctomycetota bacterium]